MCHWKLKLNYKIWGPNKKEKNYNFEISVWYIIIFEYRSFYWYNSNLIVISYLSCIKKLIVDSKLVSISNRMNLSINSISKFFGEVAWFELKTTNSMCLCYGRVYSKVVQISVVVVKFKKLQKITIILFKVTFHFLIRNF